MTTADEVGELRDPGTVMRKGAGSVLPASKVMPQPAAAPAPEPTAIEVVSALKDAGLRTAATITATNLAAAV